MNKKSIRQYLFVGAIALFFTVSCSSTPPSAPPDYSAGPPAIVEGFHATNVETITINVPRSEFFEWRSQAKLSDFLTPTEGMPAVQNTVPLVGGEWGQAGDKRRVELDDGHYAVETILSSTDDQFTYQVWGFTSPAGRFADYATGEFLYEDQGEQTRVTWTYSFRPNSLLSRIPLSLFVRNTFQGFMENGLANMKAGAEAE
ncbi:MAG: SRPBCC family protein [Phormidesmis sp.]